jgi:16S rRNA (uracil1498-N3)-methyltransferase
MYHFFVEPHQIGAEEIRIEGADVNHIRNVLRMKPGEKIMISREGGDYFCRVEELEPEYVSAKILEERENNELPARIHLFQGLPKGDKMELIIQKAVELGVYRVIPVSMKRSVVKLDAKKADAKGKRWNAAAKQSKRSLIPEVAPLMTYKEAVKEAAGYDMVLLPYESADGIRKTRELLASVKPGTDIAVFIGPEGGFEDEEVELARENRAEIVTLGKRILRTETAGLCMLSALMLQLEV